MANELLVSHRQSCTYTVALQFALGCAKARGAPSIKKPGDAGDISCTQFPRTFMYMSSKNSTTHTTAFPGSDAPCAPPVARVSRPQTGSLRLRERLYLGCWNVRTLLDVGSQAVTMRSLHDYQVDIACLSEVRLANSGSRCIKVPGMDTNYWFYHSGAEEQGQQGVALAVSQHANAAMLSWEPISSRIAVARFKGHPLNLTVIAVYAPTLPSDRDLKDEFYGRLQSVVNRVPKRDVLIIAGDWNARTGAQEVLTRHIVGKFGLGHRCENGDRLINFSDLNHLCITNTRFQHPKKHLLTWYSNDGRTANQIDYILIRSRWISSVEDCRVYRGAEAGNKGGSDHMLVRAKLRLRLTTRIKITPPKRINIGLIENSCKSQALMEGIERQLAKPLPTSPNEMKNTVDSQWTKLKSSMQQTALKELGTTRKRHKDWISENTIRLSNSARDARLSGLPKYRQLRREATRSARKDR
uniref:Endonuclease/exonuclease/phosphatase domain-containing protein n=1 Tax=Oryzias sinensis TaxID=183150 RepID=A0A8C7YE94_9TELE